MNNGNNSAPKMTMNVARIGHINLSVSNLEVALTFYCDLLDMRITKRIGDDAAFLAFGDYHHDICLNTWVSKQGAPASKGATGLYHLAILYETPEALVSVFNRLKGADYKLDSIVDHSTSLSIYLSDPDQNGVELYWDRPEAKWWSDTGALNMGYRPMAEGDFANAING